MNILFMTSAAPSNAGFSTSEKRPPLGVGTLIAVLKNRGHRVYFSDQYLKKTNLLKTNFLVEKKINFICIYSNTICFQSTLDIISDLAHLRDAGVWKGKIIVGGPHTSIGSHQIPETVDHIVIGEGEITLPKIIEGCSYDRIIYGEKVDDLDSLPSPAWEEFIHLPYDWSHTWIKSYPVYTMNTSRGCPFSCSFCSVKAVWGRSYRCISAENIIDQIEHLIKYYGAKCIYFREDHFTFSKKRTVEFCEMLLNKNIEIDWMCETRVDDLNDLEYQKLMARSGCKLFYIGVESGSNRMLEFYKKGETREQFIDAFHIAKLAGIKTYASFVVGMPGETKKDINLTESLIEITQPDFVGNNIYLGLPGSEIYNYIKEHNLFEYEDKFGILYPVGYLDNVKKYYGDNPYFRPYGSGLWKYCNKILTSIRR